MGYTLKPTTGRIACIVRRMPEKIGSIIIPDSVQAEHHAAEADVVALGADIKEIMVGDHILFNEFTGAEIELEGEWYKIVKEEDILATIEEV